ncbi:hypothetical protein BC629DRAFT_1725724 [Irpex lacteus]|nr:hypothetical protein BC629DRAFT_1725724 [Irpex lacteus]
MSLDNHYKLHNRHYKLLGTHYNTPRALYKALDKHYKLLDDHYKATGMHYNIPRQTLQGPGQLLQISRHALQYLLQCSRHTLQCSLTCATTIWSLYYKYRLYYNPVYYYCTHLDNRLAPHTIDASRIGIRILWPGYRSWEFRNMSVVDNTVNSNTYSMERLLNTLANKIWLFYQEMSSPSAGVPLDKDWALRTVDFDRLFITELQHVSQGSWQPVLYYVPA